MKKQALLCALLFISYEYYNLKSSIVAPPPVAEPKAFHLPFIKHSAIPRTYQYVFHDYLKPGNSVYLGKFKWCDTLQIPEDVISYQSCKEEREFEFLWKGMDEKFKTDGFELVPDYNSIIFYSNIPMDGYSNEEYCTYYPVYLVNTTSECRYLVLRKNRVFAFQEAANPYAILNNEFLPIEYNPEDYSEAGKSAIKVMPGEFIFFIVPRYMGSYETKIRVRVYNYDNVIVSYPFPGQINFRQFLAEPGTGLEKIIAEEDVNFSRFLRFMFLGARPYHAGIERS